MFTDKIRLKLIAGRGGNGVVAWRREKYLPKGGPYGGNGGFGGSIIFQASEQTPSLDAFRYKRIIKAENGGSGGSNNRQGKRGRECILELPLGTLVKDAESGEILYDFTDSEERFLVCHGGKGGLGNSFFKKSTNRAPNFATPGKEGEVRDVELELKSIADVGLVGFPNAGKSTLITKITNSRAKVGAYPFTTLRPNLGVVEDEEGGNLTIADIPGIIKGAHRNRGLGLEFLRHIERTKLLLFVIDGSSEDPLSDLATLEDELRRHDPRLLKKPRLVAWNKNDLVSSSYEEAVEISALTGEGVDKLVALLKRKLKM